MALQSSRGLYLFLRTLEVAVDDDVITEDEMAILNILSRCLDLPDGVIGACWAVVRGSMASPITSEQETSWSGKRLGDATCYQSAIIAALDDEVITEEEMAMLDCLRKAMGIQTNEHAMVAEAVLHMINNAGEERHRDRFEAYLTSHPYR